MNTGAIFLRAIDESGEAGCRIITFGGSLNTAAEETVTFLHVCLMLCRKSGTMSVGAIICLRELSLTSDANLRILLCLTTAGVFYASILLCFSAENPNIRVDRVWEI